MALSLTLLCVGGSYAFRRREVDPALHIVAKIPCGLHAHGWLLILLALLNIWALSATSQRFVRRTWLLHRFVTMATAFYTCLCTFVEAYFKVDSTPVWYGLAAILSILLLVLPPPFGNHDLHNRDQTTDGNNCA